MDKDKHLLLADGHVHLYACFDLPRLLDAAYANFATVAACQARGRDFSGFLLLTETADDHVFDDLFRAASPAEASDAPPSEWRFFRTAERIALLARKAEARLLLVAGRQIVTREGLEVLALGTDQRFTDGGATDETIKQVRASGALTVLPWGVGKWLGRRGRLVRAMLDESDAAARLFLGDNSGRPILWPRPELFRFAESRGLKVLPGSDPLPIPSEAARVGSFGFGLPAAPSRDRPAADLIRRLDAPDQPIFAYGEAERPLRFLRNQLRIRLQ